jgi:hypothetical protein
LVKLPGHVFAHTFIGCVRAGSTATSNIETFLQMTHAVRTIINGLLDISVGYGVANTNIHGKFIFK